VDELGDAITPLRECLRSGLPVKALGITALKQLGPIGSWNGHVYKDSGETSTRNMEFSNIVRVEKENVVVERGQV
jgi:hypothetical protein